MSILEEEMVSLFKNKKAGEKYLSIWWFFVLVVVGIGITLSVMIFYSADIDVRKTEALILHDRIFDCVTQNGFLIDEVFDEKYKLDIFYKCNLKRSLFEKPNDFFISVEFLDENGEEIADKIVEGNSAYEGDCNAIDKEVFRIQIKIFFQIVLLI